MKKLKLDQERVNNYAKASRIIDIYNDGQPHPRERVFAVYPELKAQVVGKDQSVADQLLTWAAEVVSMDDVKLVMSARVLEALVAIGFDAAGKTTDRLNALKLLGQECGMFSAKSDIGGKIVIEKIQRTIVDPISVDP